MRNKMEMQMEMDGNNNVCREIDNDGKEDWVADASGDAKGDGDGKWLQNGKWIQNSKQMMMTQKPVVDSSSCVGGILGS